MADVQSTRQCVTRVNAAIDTMENAELSEKELAVAIRKGLNKATEPTRFKDMGLEAVINGYLSGFGTPIANAISVGVQNFTAPTLELIGALTDAVKITKGNREVADSLAMFEAALEGFGADMIFLKQGWKSGYPLDITRSTSALARQLKVSPAKAREIIGKEIAASKARKQFADPTNTSSMKDLEDAYFKKGFTPDEFESYMDESYDYIRGSIPAEYGGNIIRWPTRLTVAIDEYGKARFRRQKIAQMASVKAREDSKKGLGSYRDLYNKYRKDSLRVVDEAKAEDMEDVFGQMKMDIGKVFGNDPETLVPYKSIKEFALRQTFQAPLIGFVKEAQNLRRDSALLTYFVPFIKTPWNILKEGTSFVPGLGVALRPRYLEGATPVKMSNDELIPRQILGASMFAGVAAMYGSGQITGSPRDAAEAQAWKDQGIQPFSIKIGDTWVAYQRIEPIATVLGLAADLIRITDEFNQSKDPDKDEKWLETQVKPVLTALKSNMFSKSFMEGFANITEVITDPGRYIESFTAAGLRPLSPAFLNMVARSTDPYERLATNPIEKLQQRFPFLRQELPVEYGAIGGPRETDFVQAITGFGVKSAPQSPLQAELARLDFTKGRVGDKVMRVGLNTQQLADMREMSAEMLTPVLENFIQSATYQQASDSRKKWMLERLTETTQSRVRRAYFFKLKNEDPKVARKFYNELVLSKGLEDDIPLMPK